MMLDRTKISSLLGIIFSIFALSATLEANAELSEKAVSQKPGQSCDAVVQVSGIANIEGNYLSLRSGPGTAYERIAKLKHGTQLWYCSNDADWQGVLLFEKGKDCKVEFVGAYVGPCKSGWVHKKYTRLVAG